GLPEADATLVRRTVSPARYRKINPGRAVLDGAIAKTSGNGSFAARATDARVTSAHFSRARMSRTARASRASLSFFGAFVRFGIQLCSRNSLARLFAAATACSTSFARAPL